MAWFRRGRPEADEPAPSEEGSAAGALVDEVAAAPADDDVIRPERQPTGDWMTMAPIAPTFGAMPQSFRVQTLPEILPSHHNVRLSGSLGHRVSADAPSGSVSGLAVSTGPVSATAGHDDLPLREPHHDRAEAAPLAHAPAGAPAAEAPVPDAPSADAPAADVPPAPPADDAAPLPVRPLPTVVDTEPLPLARLPEPAVSRALADPLPLVAPAASSAAGAGTPAPLPVARVVDVAAPSHSHSPSPAAPASDAPSADAPLGGDTRVGGFAASLDDLPDLTSAGERSELFTAPPDELAAPILPRVRRGGAQELPTVQPLLTPGSRPEGRDPGVKSEEEGEGEGEAATLGPLPTTSTEEGPIGNAGAPVRETIGLPVESLPLAPPPDAGPALTPPAAPAVQRQADAAPGPGPGPTTSAALPPSDPDATGHDAAGDVAPLAGDAGPVSAAATPSAPAGAGDTVPPEPTSLDLPLVAGPADAAPGATPPVAGDRPLVGDAAIEPETVTPASPAVPTPARPAPLSDLPLPIVQRRVEGPTATTSPTPLAFGHERAPERAFVAESGGEAGPAPLVGDTEVATIAATATHDGGEDGPATTAPAPSATELPLVTPAPAATSTAPLLGDSGPTPPLVGRAPAAEGLHVQRRLKPVHAATRAAATPQPAPSFAPPESGTPALGLPLAPRPPGGSSAPPPAPATAPLSSLGAVHVAGPEPVQTLAVARLADGHAAGPASSASTLDAPPMALQTLAAPAPTPSPSTATSTATSAAPDMPLHTAAAHVPSAAQIMVSAGLAERGPNGTLLFANPPTPVDDDGEAVQRELVVQRHEEDAAAASDGGGGGGNQGITVARIMTMESPRAEPGGGGKGGEETLQDEAQKLADDARRLYPHIRMQLESDIRRQLEARNRAGRYRP